MICMKRSLIFFLLIFLFILFNKPGVNAISCSYNYYYNNVSTLNFENKFKNYKNIIIKICTDDICTYNYFNNLNFLLKRHKINFLESLSNKELKQIYGLKGFKIDKIYFTDCI